MWINFFSHPKWLPTKQKTTHKKTYGSFWTMNRPRKVQIQRQLVLINKLITSSDQDDTWHMTSERPIFYVVVCQPKISRVQLTSLLHQCSQHFSGQSVWMSVCAFCIQSLHPWTQGRMTLWLKSWLKAEKGLLFISVCCFKNASGTRWTFIMWKTTQARIMDTKNMVAFLLQKFNRGQEDSTLCWQTSMSNKSTLHQTRFSCVWSCPWIVSYRRPVWGWK